MRRDCPAAWELALGECQAGLRRYAGTDRGESYQRTGAIYGEGDFSDPGVYERTLGDLLSPTRPGRMVDVVNTVTRDSGIDAERWTVQRLLSMIVNIEQEANQRPSPED